MVILFVISLLLLIYSLLIVFLNNALKYLTLSQNLLTPPVSVIVPAHNEQQNIRQCIMAILQQNYPDDLYEIIVVDDHSADNTYPILLNIRKLYPKVQILKTQYNLQTHPTGSKKLALTTGIAHASHELLLFTDADCRPPRQWIQSTVSCFDEHTGFVSGFSPLVHPGHSLFGKLIEFDSLAAATYAAGGISRNFPITCTGRNLAYRKSAFNQVSGFTDIMKSISGDDDLLMHLISQRTNWKLKYNISPDSVVPSIQAKTLRQLITQKQRHISTGKHFPISVKLFYMIIHLTNIGCYLFLGFSLITGSNQLLATSLLLTKIFLNYIFLRSGAIIFKMTHLLKYFLLWEIFSLF